MKYNILALIILLGLFNACDVDDIIPINELTEDNVVTDAASANALLNRVYTLHRNRESGSTNAVDMAIGFSVSGIDQEQRFRILPDLADFNSNSIKDDSPTLKDYYIELYSIINHANFLIEKLEEGVAVDLSNERSLEMQAEARTMRAMAHFHALRTWGQFYDRNSELGVVISTKPIRGAQDLPRSTVQAVYDAIITDLDFAVTNGPSNRERFYVSSTFAQALLGKVQLYMGEYAAAASNAKAVIDNTADNFELYTGIYTDIWAEQWNNAEVLFAPFANGRLNNEDSGEGKKILFGCKPSSVLQTIANNSTGADDANIDPRYFANFFEPTIKYPRNDAEEGNTYYYMRMAELYLIHAEAEIRKDGGNSTLALTSLNAVRQRQAMPDKSFVDKATILKDIKDEKSLELFSETGESWFDMVRYHFEGDIDALVLKQSLTDVNQFIFPIPVEAIGGNPALVQNP
ncbi:RagB/SusD family nutrient uptake outer membrane protein [Marinifilum flexuosum]|nr:RagB/SusD family nutrient uptake outer membrane protein [Marinifilum flexuosum]